MMDKTTTTRRSHCIICGKRLSAITATGKIRWQPSQVDEKGLICDICSAKESMKGKKGSTHPDTRS